MNIDRLVLDYHACDDQASLNRFWERVPADMEEALIDRLDELFPADPNECSCDPYRLRTKALSRGMEEWMAHLAGYSHAIHCTQRQGRTETCERCEAFLIDHPKPPWAE